MNRVVETLKQPKGREPIAWVAAGVGTASGWITDYFNSIEAMETTRQWETTLNLIISLCNP